MLDKSVDSATVDYPNNDHEMLDALQTTTTKASISDASDYASKRASTRATTSKATTLKMRLVITRIAVQRWRKKEPAKLNASK